MGELLSVKNINVYYGSIHAIKDVSFHVDEGEIVTLIGANGAGKTTTMHAISGLLKLASGEITYDGNLISKMEAHKIVRLGLAQVPEGRRVFSGLTVQQNLSMGAYTRHDGKDAIQSDYDMVFDLLPRLKERRNQPAGTLSGTVTSQNFLPQQTSSVLDQLERVSADTRSMLKDTDEQLRKELKNMQMLR